MKTEQSVAGAAFFSGVTGIIGSFLLKKTKYDRLAKGLLIGSSLAAAGGAIAFTATTLSQKKEPIPLKYTALKLSGKKQDRSMFVVLRGDRLDFQKENVIFEVNIVGRDVRKDTFGPPPSFVAQSFEKTKFEIIIKKFNAKSENDLNPYDKVFEKELLGSQFEAEGLSEFIPFVKDNADYFKGYLTPENHNNSSKIKAPIKYSDFCYFGYSSGSAPAEALKHPNWHPRDFTSVPFNHENEDNKINIKSLYFNGFENIEGEKIKNKFEISYIANQGNPDFEKCEFYVYTIENSPLIKMKGNDFEKNGFSREAVEIIKENFNNS